MSYDNLQSLKMPTLEEIQAAHQRLQHKVVATPSWHWQSGYIQSHLGDATKIQLKLELLQHTGTFKARAAFLHMMALDKEQLRRGVTAVSAGNHAIAVAYASKMMQISAKVVMPKNANPVRVARCRELGAEIVLADNVHKSFEAVREIEVKEGRVFIHPFESEHVTLGTASLGYEFYQQVGELDAIIIPIGGGGLCSGVASAIKQLVPSCKIYGVEPSGADSMRVSLELDKPSSIESVNTIADSLGAPYAAPYSFSLCKALLDELVLVDDDAMCHALYLLFTQMKLAVEPAGAASTAALFGPLKERLKGMRVGLIVCGANIDANHFCTYLMRGQAMHSAKSRLS